MASALIYGPSGSGKTVSSTRVMAPDRGRNVLLCSDNSWRVLNNFKRDNLDIVPVEHWIKHGKTMQNETCFKEQFDRAVDSKMYDNIIVDNISDLCTLAVDEYREDKTFSDIRMAYLELYTTLKQLTRKAGQLDCNVLFTAWEEMYEAVQSDGSVVNCVRPQIPEKIIQNVCGLMNVVGRVCKAKDEWVYQLEATPSVMAKDQLKCRQWCRPEDIFNV